MYRPCSSILHSYVHFRGFVWGYLFTSHAENHDRESNGIHHPQNWLVVGPPLWKIWLRQLGWWDIPNNPNILENIKLMFQPNHQPENMAAGFLLYHGFTNIFSYMFDLLIASLPTSSHHPRWKDNRRRTRRRLNCGAQQQVHQGREAGAPSAQRTAETTSHQAMSVIFRIILR